MDSFDDLHGVLALPLSNVVYGDVYLDVAVKRWAIRTRHTWCSGESRASATSQQHDSRIHCLGYRRRSYWVQSKQDGCCHQKDKRSTAKVICFDTTRINAVSRQKTSNCRIRNGSVARRSKAIFRSCLLSCNSEGKDTSPSGEARQTVR